MKEFIFLTTIVIALAFGLEPETNKFQKECDKHGAFYVTNCKK